MKRPVPTKPDIDIYEYLDFRKYLKDLFAEFKSRRRGFTLKTLAEKAGVKSLSLFKMIVDGERNLTAEMLDAFSTALDIKGKEKLYLEVLVRYNQEDDPEKKHEHFELLNELRPRSHKFTLEKRHRRYLTRDYYVTIREMAALKDFREDYAWIAARCAPAITVNEAKEAVATLLELGLLARDENGKLIQSRGHVRTTDYDNQALEAYHYHQAVLNKAKASLGYLGQEKRSYQALTIALPKKIMPEIIDKYYELRDWIVAKSDEAGAGDEVFQFNFQLFPVTWGKSGDE